MFEQGLWGLANLVANDEHCAKLVTSHADYGILFSITEASIRLVLRTYIWIFSCTLKYRSLDVNPARPWSKIISVCQYALTEDSTPRETIEEALSLLGLLSRHSFTLQPMSQICTPTLLKYVNGPSECCQYIAVWALGNMVADDSGAVSLAGIMGGNSTAVSENTTDLMLEAANWLRAREGGE